MVQTQQTGEGQDPQSNGVTSDRPGEQAHFHATGEDFLECLASRSHKPDAVPHDIAQRELDVIKIRLP